MTKNDSLAMLRKLFPAEFHDRIVLVGGSVRDMLLNRESQDIDVVAALPHDLLLRLGFRLVAAKSATTIYFTHRPDHGKIEVTRIADLTELGNDLSRRDFTVNAMAMDMTGQLLDPLGSLEDLQEGLLRPCNRQSFSTDHLRIFRAFRFEACGWQMTQDCAALIREHDWSNSPTIPVERFCGEMLKALGSKAPELFFRRMLEFSAGAVILPEIFRMAETPAGPPQHHPEGDLLTHSVQVLQQVTEQTDDKRTRFCAFFHDIGKLATDPALYPKHHGHDEAGFAMAEQFCNRLCLPASYRRALAWTSRLHGKANKWDELRDSSKVRVAEQAAKAGIVQILRLVSAADKPGPQTMAEWDAAVRVAAMNSMELGIDRNQLDAMPIGSRLAFLHQKRVEAMRSQKTKGS